MTDFQIFTSLFIRDKVAQAICWRLKFHFSKISKQLNWLFSYFHFFCVFFPSELPSEKSFKYSSYPLSFN
jgi:hypothetical protein